jgi:hypothetical protein
MRNATSWATLDASLDATSIRSLSSLNNISNLEDRTHAPILLVLSPIERGIEDTGAGLLGQSPCN